MRSAPERSNSWLAAAAVAALVILAGARLITLSARDHAAQLRSAAESAVSRQAGLIEVQLQALLDRAQNEARRAAGAAIGGERMPPLTVLPDRHAFWIAPAGTLMRTGDTDSGISQELAGDWMAAQTRGRETTGALFGPVRYGSQWFVAAQVPVETAGAASRPAVRAVAYEALDEPLLRAGVGRLAGEGYDFELFQDAQPTGEPRVLLRSRAAVLDRPVTAAVRVPGTATPAPVYLELALRPHSGWFPIGPLAADLAVLILIAWATAFGAYDMLHNVRHARRALAMARGRLRSINARLAAEIEQHEDLQRNLEHARYHDPSTGLPNRRYFMGQVDRALRELHAGRRQRLGIILVEIDRLAFINDTLGHTAADDLLLQAAHRFANVLEGREHTLARWSANQCVALLQDADSPGDVRACAEALQGARQEPFALRRHRVRAATRIGFTCIEPGLRRPEEALREADVALSMARHRLGPPTVGYTPDMGDAAVSLVSLEADLHLALERGEFKLVFQPIFELSGLRAVGVEALLRWHHPVEGVLEPERFLAIAEEVGVLVPVTRWIIQQVCRLVAEWRLSLPRDADFYISINLSAAALRDPGLWEHVTRVMQATGVPAGYLKFELAERGLIENVSAVRATLAAFHNMGIELMLDDFGTGHSSLSYLQLLPFDYIKIDRPFANRTGSERANNAITSAILQMTSSLGLRAVAEVVETEEAARALAELGCNFAQGYYFAPPLAAPQALELLRRSPTPSTIVAALGPAAEKSRSEPTVAVPTLVEATLAEPALVEATLAEPAMDETMILEDTPTLVLPDTATLVLEAAVDAGIEDPDEAAAASPHAGR